MLGGLARDDHRKNARDSPIATMTSHVENPDAAMDATSAPLIGQPPILLCSFFGPPCDVAQTRRIERCRQAPLSSIRRGGALRSLRQAARCSRRFALHRPSHPLVQRGEKAPSGMFLHLRPLNQPQHVGNTSELSTRDRVRGRQQERDADVAVKELNEDKEPPAQWWSPPTSVCDQVSYHKRQYQWKNRHLRPTTPRAG